ncbi:anaphase-promoting complex subunit 11 [Syzygium oleosum]|uniref:anaphase-promoting complex subunit 11 n=1 Tax=Syzygium oleosum TaxID=219896 RepID=UPI0024BAD8D0|nr:anaphase-promoting complex subunit 11 [Syzygium oleosum]
MENEDESQALEYPSHDAWLRFLLSNIFIDWPVNLFVFHNQMNKQSSNESYGLRNPKSSVYLNHRWHAVASWTWDAQDETCGICRMAFDGCCPDCKLPGDDCPLIWGACNHAFHLHCILKWVNSQTSQAHCPMCRREWQFKE